MEELLSREKVMEEIKGSLDALGEDRKPFTFDDDRKRVRPPPRPPQPEASIETDPMSSELPDPPDIPVIPKDSESLADALRKFLSGALKSPFVGDTDLTSNFSTD